VWLHPEIFRIDLTAGAPPDMYTPEGQSWGFPLFRWENLRQNDYLWWRQRLQASEIFYDLCRLDHIIGFFRIWAIPPGMPGTAGSFIPPDRNTWLDHGRDILLMIGRSTTMLPIGEDLGDIPHNAHDFLQSMGICGTRIMRWQREISSVEGRYIDPSKYHPISMTSVSTHDSETMHMWWKKYEKDAKLFAEMKGWKYHPELTSEQHGEILYDSHHSASLFHINLLQEYLALFPELRWENTDWERVNFPGSVSPVNWSCRYKPSVEEIISNDKLSSAIQKLLL
jgi:4-alpha-glucanotransferase